MIDLTALLACPACHSPLEEGVARYRCSGCACVFDVSDGIPVLLSAIDELTRKQAQWFDTQVDDEYEIERPRRTPSFHAWLLGEKFRRSVTELRPLLDGGLVLSVCAGSGMDAEFLAREGARAVAVDISLGAARRTKERARRHGVAIVPLVADTTRLPFRDRSFDVVYVHDGLHHLGDPLAGISEMSRVARRAVSISEPARAAATALSVKLGYSGETEEAGNPVRRLRRIEIERMLSGCGFEIVRSTRYAMVYRHEAGTPIRVLSLPGISALGRVGFVLANLLLAPIGNKLAIQAVRAAPARGRLAIHDYAGHPFQVQLSRELARRGFDVVHLHCPSYPTGRGRLDRASDDPERFSSEPVRLSHGLRKYNPVRRLLQDLEYGRLLGARIRSLGPACVVSANTPILAQWLALNASRRRGATFVFWQQDAHGQAMRAIASARFPVLGHLIGGMFPALERRLLRRSDAVVAISPDFVPALLDAGVESQCLAVVENWAPLEELPQLSRTNGWAAQHGLLGRHVILYAGTLGLKHDPTLLFDLATHVESRGDVTVVVASEGLGGDLLRERLRSKPLESLLLLPFQPYELLPEMLASADVLVSMLGEELGAYSVPSKVLTYLCAGRALLAGMPAENPAARLIERTQAGIVVDPGDRQAFLEAAARLLDDDEGRARMGERAREFAEQAFDIGAIGDRFEAVIASARAERQLGEALSVRRGGSAATQRS